MRDNNLMKDGDWLSKDAAARDGLPPHFTDDQIRAKMAEVSHGRHPGLAEVSHGRHPGQDGRGKPWLACQHPGFEVWCGYFGGAKGCGFRCRCCVMGIVVGQWAWYGGVIKWGWGSSRDGNEGWAEFEVWCGWCVCLVWCQLFDDA